MGHLKAGLVVIMTKKNPILNRKRMYYQRETIKWTLNELRKPPYGSGTFLPVHPCAQIFGSYYWQAVRKCVMDRDDGKCRICGQEGQEVHHILYRQNGGTDHPRNLLTLCEKCHDEIHSGTLRLIGIPGLGVAPDEVSTNGEECYGDE